MEQRLSQLLPVGEAWDELVTGDDAQFGKLQRETIQIRDWSSGFRLSKRAGMSYLRAERAKLACTGTA
jgi:hypothetical protein